SAFFFFHDTAPSETNPLSLHDALPISASVATMLDFPLFTRPTTAKRGGSLMAQPLAVGRRCTGLPAQRGSLPRCALPKWKPGGRDRKSTRLNSSHVKSSYAVFCLKKKK